MRAEDYVQTEMEDGRTREELIGEAYDDLNYAERELRLLNHRLHYIQKEIAEVSKGKREATLILRELGEDE